MGPSHPQPAPLPRVGRQPIDKTPSGFIVGENRNSQTGLCQSPGLPRPSLGSPHRGGRPPPSTLRRLLRPPPPRQTGAEPMCSEKTRRNPSRHKKKRRRMGNLSPGQQPPTNAKHDRRGDEMRLPVLRTCLHRACAHATHAEPCSRLRRLTLNDVQGEARLAQPKNLDYHDRASGTKQALLRSQGSYCLLPCTAYYCVLLTIMHCLRQCTAY